jgi:hypothetical protein
VEKLPLRLMILDGLADDFESVESLRDHGEVAQSGLALIDERDAVDALRRLLEDELIEARAASGNPYGSCPRRRLPPTTRACGATGSGDGPRRACAAGRSRLLDAHYDEHPGSDGGPISARPGRDATVRASMQ